MDALTEGEPPEKLVRYVVALANERGGKIILGVTDKRPRKVVGTRAFAEPGRLEAGLFERLRQRVSVEEVFHEKVVADEGINLAVHDLVVLDLVHR